MHKTRARQLGKGVVIKPIRSDETPLKPKQIKGYNLFNEIYANVFLSARKKSGKTTVIDTILRHCRGIDRNGKPTKIIAFVSTLNKDASWRAIAKKYKKHFTGYTSLFDEDGANRLEKIGIAAQEEVSSGQSSSKSKAKPSGKQSGGKAPDLFGPHSSRYGSAGRPVHISAGILKSGNAARRVFEGKGPERKLESKRKSGKVAPSYIFIFDDLAGEVKNKYLSQFLKKNRHFKAKCLISSQNFTDIPLMGRAQIDYLLLWKGLSLDRIDKIQSESANFVEPDEFVRAYRDATGRPYGFLKIDRVEDQLGDGFNTIYDFA